jgi:hypothetical protein
MHQALRRPEDDGSAFELIRGARAFIVAAALACIALGVSGDSKGLVWFGIAFLAEEIYETGVILLILRYGRARGLL